MKLSAQEGWKIWREALNERMEELGMNYYQVGEISGVNRSDVGRYLKGEREPGIVNLLAILGALKINPQLIFKEEDDKDYNYLHFN